MTYPPIQPGKSDNWPDPSWPSPQQYPDPMAQASGPGGYGFHSAPPMVAQPYPLYPPPVSRETNGMAVAGLVCAIAGLFTCGITSLIGAILGHVSRSQIRKNGQDGDGVALAAIVVGWIVTVLALLFGGYLVVMFVIALNAAKDVDYGTDYSGDSDWNETFITLGSLVAHAF